VDPILFYLADHSMLNQRNIFFNMILALVPTLFMLIIPIYLYAQATQPASDNGQTMQDLMTTHYVPLGMWVLSGIFLLTLGWKSRSYLGRQLGNRVKIINRLRALEEKAGITPKDVDRIDEGEE